MHGRTPYQGNRQTSCIGPCKRQTPCPSSCRPSSPMSRPTTQLASDEPQESVSTGHSRELAIAKCAKWSASAARHSLPGELSHPLVESNICLLPTTRPRFAGLVLQPKAGRTTCLARICPSAAGGVRPAECIEMEAWSCYMRGLHWWPLYLAPTFCGYRCPHPVCQSVNPLSLLRAYIIILC